MTGLPSRGLAAPGRQALRGYTDPGIDPKFAPSRGGIAALYDARLRASKGKPLRNIGGPEAVERALQAYEGGGPRVTEQTKAPTETLGGASAATTVLGPEGGALSAAEAERKKAKKKSGTILG